MDKFKSFYGTLLIIIILLNFVSVCATNEGSKKSKSTDGSVDNGSGTKTSTEKPSHTVTPTKGGNAPSSSGSPSASPPGGETSSPGGGTSPPGGEASPPGGGTSPPGGEASPPGGGTSPPGGGASPPGGGASPPGGGTSPPGGGASSPGGGTSPPGGGASSPGGGTSPPGASSPGGGAPGTPSAPSVPSTGTGTIPGGESNATMLAYVLFSNSPSTTTIGRPEVKGLISLFQPPNGNTVVTGQIGAILDRVNGNYKFTIQDGGGVIYYDCTGRVNPLFIGQASLFSFTWSDIKLPIAIGKRFVITESGGTLVNGLIVEEFGFP